MAMDVAQLRQRIQWTIGVDADLRRQAELDLSHAENQPGFLEALLSILQTDSQIDIRQCAAIYLKNRTGRAWEADTSPTTTVKPIPASEKANLKAQLLPLISSSPPQIRAQLLPILGNILSADFPSRWPEFFDTTNKLLNTNEANSVFAGLQGLLAICRMYRFKGGEQRIEFNQIVAAAFPRLLVIANGLVQDTSAEAWDMLHITLKAYKHTIYFDLPPYLQSQDCTVGWCTLFLTVIDKAAPEYAMSEDDDERERCRFWKTKKWAFANLNRLFVRFGQRTNGQKKVAPELATFAKNFQNTFAPEILNRYLQAAEKWASKTSWLSKPCLSYILMFIEECIKPLSMWRLLKPHLETLISHVVFPVLCQSDEDLEQFDSDPSEYLHRKLNYYEEISAPDVAASNFLVSLTKSRREQTYSILSFVNTIVNRYECAPPEQKNAREKEGALRMIGNLSGILLSKKSPIADQVEYFFVRHVFPEFRSPCGFLRARACDTLGKFEQLEFSSANLFTMYQNILECMADPELPVRVEAALALQPLIRHDIIRTSMQQNIPQIMQQLLKLANEVDVDSLANVMEDFVEEFAAELTPFAVALSEQLRDTYLRIIRDLIERNANGKETDETYGEYLDDKSITALGVLQTIGTLILTLEATPDVLLHLETVLMPVIQTTLENNLYDLYNEVFEIIDSCIFSAKQISPTMWQAFELMHRTFKAGAELYLEDMLPALENFVTYGASTIAQNPAYLEGLVGMVADIFRDEKVGGMDRICGCRLAEAIMLNLRGHVDTHIPQFVESAMLSLSNAEPKVKSYRIHLIEMVINSIYYNPLITLQFLETKAWTNKFFGLWFSNIENFTRVHDKKLSIVAISSLLTLNSSQIPSSLQAGWPRLMSGVIRLFQTLPVAIKNREEAAKDEYDVDDDGDAGAEDDTTGDTWTENAQADEADEADGDEDGDDGDLNDEESGAYLDFLAEEAQKASASDDESEDDLDEETLSETPLDKIEPYGFFKNAFFQLQVQQPQFYASLGKILDPAEQAMIESIIVQANAEAAAAAAAESAIT